MAAVPQTYYMCLGKERGSGEQNVGAFTDTDLQPSRTGNGAQHLERGQSISLAMDEGRDGV